MRTAPKAPRTDAGIAKLPQVSREVLTPFGGSLYLKRRPNGRCSWVLRTRIGGKWQVRQLGDWPTVGLHLARQRGEAGRASLGRADANSTVSHALETFKREYIGTRYRTDAARKESGALLDKALTAVANRALPGLRRLDLTGAVQQLADRPNTAAKSLALLKQFTGWAVARGLLEVDPLGGVTAKRLGLQAYAPRERVLAPSELQQLWKREDPDSRILKFCALTACRIGEALQWAPDQVRGNVWTIPDTKSGRPHTVPLTSQAAGLLPLPAPMPAYSSIAQRLQQGGHGWTAHDLRRTAATIMREVGIPVHDVEAVLNHAPPRLVRVYQRHDPLEAKAAALGALAERLAEICGGE